MPNASNSDARKRLAENAARVTESATVERLEALHAKWASTPDAYANHGSHLRYPWISAAAELRAALDGVEPVCRIVIDQDDPA